MKTYSIAKPHIGEKEIKAVIEVLKSGSLSLGPYYKKFEESFAKKIGVKFACAVSSGTAGLHLAMIAAGVREGDEIITSPFSFIASANCILYVGARPVFVDIDPATYNIDPKKIEEKITKKTKAILVAHIFGQTADMDPIRALAKKYDLKIIEDACESILAEYKGKKAGTFGESAVFAFYPNKQMTTGEGGMLVTDQEKIYKMACSLRNQGRSENMQWLDHRLLGYNYRMDEMSAALGLIQLQKIDWLIEERRKVAKLYEKHLFGHNDLLRLPVAVEGNTHTWFVYAVKIKNKKTNRNEVIEKMKNRGISAKPYLPSIHLFKFYREKFGFKNGDFPVSEEISRYSLALPLYIGLKEKDIKYISGELAGILKKIK